MSRVRLPGLGIQHQLCIAMISGYQHLATSLLQGLVYPSKYSINFLNCLDRRCKLPGMANHVRVGVITNNNVIDSTLDRRHQVVGNLGRTHFRLQIIGCHHRRFHKDAVFPFIGSLYTTVKKESNVRVFLGFGKTQLA